MSFFFYGKVFCCIFACSLGFEPLGDEGVCSIASALKENSTLIDLSYVKYCTDCDCEHGPHIYISLTCRLTKTEFSVEGLRYMAEMIPQNKKLEVIR